MCPDCSGIMSSLACALAASSTINRLCDPESKLGVLRWLETVSLPGLSMQSISHQHLLRAMDALVDQQAAVDKTVAHLLRPLVDQELSVVFYDMTTIRAAGLSEQQSDVRQFGMSKEGLIGYSSRIRPPLMIQTGHLSCSQTGHRECSESGHPKLHEKRRQN